MIFKSSKHPLILALSLFAISCAQKGDMGGDIKYPATKPVPPRLEGAQSYSAQADESLNNAQALLSDEQALASEQKAITSAAVAAAPGESPEYVTPKPEDVQIPDVKNFESSKKSGGRVGGSSQFGQAPAIKTTKTDPNDGPDLTPRLAGNQGANSLYAGAGTAAAAQQKSGFSSVLGMFSNPGFGVQAQNSGKTNEMDFDGSRSPASVLPEGSDPENYLSFIDINDSLFKVVERRYKKKAMDWSYARAKEAAR